MTSKNYELTSKTRFSTYDSTKSTFRITKNGEDKKLHSLKKKLSISINFTGVKPLHIFKNRPSPLISQNMTSLQSKISLYRTISETQNSLKLNNNAYVPQIQSSAVYSMFTDSNQTFLEKNAHEKRQIASLTKIMTAYTVIKICNSYGIKIRQTMITVQKQASLMEGTSANLRGGDRFLVIDLLYGLLLPSGNDAALALAQYFGKFLSFTYSTKQYETICKNQQNICQFEQNKQFYDENYAQQSIKLFVFEMNKITHKIQLKNTKFSNPTGLAHKGNYSTAYDISKLISICLKNSLMRHIFKKKVYTCFAVNQKLGLKRQIEWKNTNQHLFCIRECIGAKTGITPAAGPCLSTVYKIRGRELVIVILNSKSLQDRYVEAQKIFYYAKYKLDQPSQKINN